MRFDDDWALYFKLIYVLTSYESKLNYSDWYLKPIVAIMQLFQKNSCNKDLQLYYVYIIS